MSVEVQQIRAKAREEREAREAKAREEEETKLMKKFVPFLSHIDSLCSTCNIYLQWMNHNAIRSGISELMCWIGHVFIVQLIIYWSCTIHQ